MKTYNNIEEVKADIKDNVLRVDDDIEIAFDGFDISADIICHNIYSKGGRRKINAGNIDAWNIDADDIDATEINAWKINAGNIDAWNIDAEDIDAGDINYYAVCFAYKNITCKSIEGRRENAKHFCLDRDITFKEETLAGKEVEVKIDGKTYKAKIIE